MVLDTVLRDGEFISNKQTVVVIAGNQEFCRVSKSMNGGIHGGILYE
jgi:hypothetical protein